MYLFTLNSFLLWLCGQISLLLMLKTHSTVQRGSNLLFNDTHLFMLFTQSFGASTDVYLISVSLSYMYCVSTYIN